MIFKKKDIMGEVLLDYLNGEQNTEVILYSHSKINNRYILKGKDRIGSADFFKKLEDLQEVDKYALNLCYGRVLDIGAGSGSHSLILMERGIDIHSLDISAGAVEVMKRRGLERVHCNDITKFKAFPFDTLVLFGNNHGLFGNIKALEGFLCNITHLLKPEGQILIPSPYVNIPIKCSSIEDTNPYITLSLTLEYKGSKSKTFEWFMIEPEYFKNYFKKYDWEIKTTNLDQEKTCLIRLTKLTKQ